MFRKLTQPKGRSPALAKVSGVLALSPSMIRLTFYSDWAKSLDPGTAGDYIKLNVPAPGVRIAPSAKPDMLKKTMRTYTLRHVRPKRGEFDVDFVVHGTQGIAGPWAKSAKPGDEILVSGPGPLKFDRSSESSILVVADLSAIPAAAAILEASPLSLRGDAFFAIPSDLDIQPINTPAGLNVHWLVGPHVESLGRELVRTVKAAPLSDHSQRVFVAGEFSFVGELRSYFRKDRGFLKENLYISSYWKNGLIEPEHKLVKSRAA